MKSITIVIALLLVCTISARDVYRKILERLEADEKLLADQIQKSKIDKKSTIKTSKREHKEPRFVDENGLPLDHFYMNENNPNIHGQHEGDYLKDGDIMYQPGEREKFFGKKGEEGNKQNDGLRDPRRRWNNGVVPYVIDSSLLDSETPSEAMNSINAAIKDLNSKTCLKLREKIDSDANYINFTKSDGCWSYVGRIGGKQEVSIGDGCFYKSTVVHEIMHAIGFHHEQSRPDRDEYVRINYGNIIPGYENQFEKETLRTVSYFGHEYDYESIMHYGALYFSKNRKPTITAKKGNKQKQKLGQGWYGEMTATDIAQIRAMYNCNTIPTEAPVTTTAAPVITTEAPVITTEAPVITTEEPVITTEEPLIATEEPLIATEAPVITTEEPVTINPVITTTPNTGDECDYLNDCKSEDQYEVCGTDGNTYRNECEMDFHNCKANTMVMIDYEGKCNGAPVTTTTKAPVTTSPVNHCETIVCPMIFKQVCGTDGLSYDNECEMKRESCETGSYVTVDYEGPCNAINGCENLGICPKIFKQVCGTDGLTYENECEMKQENCETGSYVTVDYEGPCNATTGNGSVKEMKSTLKSISSELRRFIGMFKKYVKSVGGNGRKKKQG